jgi:ribonuclease HII
MPWYFGIDEAGYGPNLGPLLQTSIGVFLPTEAADLWRALDSAVRRCGTGRDARMMIDDSKKVFGPARNIANLEHSVLATLFPADTRWPMSVGQFLSMVAPATMPGVRTEPWFDESEPIPIAARVGAVERSADNWQAACQKISMPPIRVRCHITPPARFNSLLDEKENKAEVVAHGVRWLIRDAREPDDGIDPILFAVDRLGGRMYHSELLRTICPDGWIEVVDESETCCRYRMVGRRALEWSFEVDADSRHFTVALASMVSKYIRELLMGQFNRFWQTHVPGLKATAGYPVDAVRFIAQIRPAMQRLQVEERIVWRRK